MKYFRHTQRHYFVITHVNPIGIKNTLQVEIVCNIFYLYLLYCIMSNISTMNFSYAHKSIV